MKSPFQAFVFAAMVAVLPQTTMSALAQTCSASVDAITISAQYDSGSLTYNWTVTNGNAGVGNRIETVYFEVGTASWSSPATSLATWSAASSSAPGYAAVRFLFSSGPFLNDGRTENFSYVLDAPVTSVRVRVVRQNAKIDDYTAFSDLTPCGILPVELVDFRAQRDGDRVRLLWQTVSEVSNAGFEVQYRAAGEFAAVGFVEGRGSSQEAHSYSYDVPFSDPIVGDFRLRIVAIDGSFQYSPVIRVAHDLPQSIHLSQSFPNPFNPTTSMTLLVDVDQTVRVEVFDLTGRRLASLHDGLVRSGVPQEITFEASALPSGLYVIRAQGSSLSAMRTATLLK
jgi:hypothetical protein